MSKDDEGKYWSDPRAELDKLPFDQLNVCVDGILLVQATTTPDPTFSPAAGSVVPGTTIAISDSDTTATIYYTTDGTVPTTNSNKYTTAIAIGTAGAPVAGASSVTIQAFAVSPNKTPSNTVIGVFSPTATAPAPAPAATTINIGAKPVGAAVGAPVAIPVTVSGTGAGTCTGAITSSVTLVSTAAVVASIPSALTSGAGSVTFTPAAAGSYAIVVTYAPDAASLCGAGSQNASVTLP